MGARRRRLLGVSNPSAESFPRGGGGSDDKDEGPNPVQLALLEDDSDEEMEIVLDIESGLSRESDKYETSTVTEEANLTRESLRERDEEEGGEDIETPVEDESDDNWDNDGKKAAAPGTPRQSQRKSLFGLVEERPETAYSTDGHDRMTTHQRSSIAAVKRASVRRASVAAELEDHLKSAGPAETIFDVPQVRASLRRASSISMSLPPLPRTAGFPGAAATAAKIHRGAVGCCRRCSCAQRPCAGSSARRKHPCPTPSGSQGKSQSITVHQRE